MGQGASAEASPCQAASRGDQRVTVAPAGCSSTLGLWTSVAPSPPSACLSLPSCLPVSPSQTCRRNRKPCRVRPRLAAAAAAAACRLPAGDVVAVEQWLRAGGDPNAVHKSLKGTALQAAARGDHVECLEVGGASCSWPGSEAAQPGPAACDHSWLASQLAAIPCLSSRVQTMPCLTAPRSCCCATEPTSTWQQRRAQRCMQPPAAAATVPSACCCGGEALLLAAPGMLRLGVLCLPRLKC